MKKTPKTCFFSISPQAALVSLVYQDLRLFSLLTSDTTMKLGEGLVQRQKKKKKFFKKLQHGLVSQQKEGGDVGEVSFVSDWFLLLLCGICTEEKNQKKL